MARVHSILGFLAPVALKEVKGGEIPTEEEMYMARELSIDMKKKEI